MKRRRHVRRRNPAFGGVLVDLAWGVAGSALGVVVASLVNRTSLSNATRPYAIGAACIAAGAGVAMWKPMAGVGLAAIGGATTLGAIYDRATGPKPASAPAASPAALAALTDSEVFAIGQLSAVDGDMGAIVDEDALSALIGQ